MTWDNLITHAEAAAEPKSLPHGSHTYALAKNNSHGYRGGNYTSDPIIDAEIGLMILEPTDHHKLAAQDCSRLGRLTCVSFRSFLGIACFMLNKNCIMLCISLAER